MIIVTLKVDEEVCIGDEIVVKIIKIKSPHTTKLGITAPRHIAIRRDNIKNETPKQ
jgi:carbon storage regulator CsrA